MADIPEQACSIVLKSSTGDSYLQGTDGGINSSDRMTSTFASGTLADGVAVTQTMLNAPLPCVVYINPESGDTVQLWYLTNAGYTSVGSYTVYTEVRLISSVQGIKVQRTAGSGTTSTWEVL